jgi:hypothetical protein
MALISANSSMAFSFHLPRLGESPRIVDRGQMLLELSEQVFLVVFSLRNTT